ncbi:MAG TPA: hypothetical protein VGQ99_17045 [Tepidisphaeraceae bacterium]|jgi:hypothetical protein|nr:hypothetical protein [Tepidisphaeraceae bacterium]
MASPQIKDAPAQIPDGYAIVAVSAEQKSAPLKIGVIVKKQADPVAGHLVMLRDLLDAQVYLGCVTDASGRVQQWVEIWVQSTSGLAGSLPASRETLSNAVLDDRWERLFKAFERLDAATIIRGGWETSHPKPIFLDVVKLEPVHPDWVLCETDSLLTKKGLPPFSTSIHRYLYQKAAGEGSALVPVSVEAPTNDNTKPMTEITGGKKELVPFNAGGGLMLVRTYSPLSYEAFVDFVGGGISEGIAHGKSSLHLRSDAPTGNGEGSLTTDGWLYLGKHGKSGRLLETLHLKLRAMADAVDTLRFVVKEHQRPLLNVSSDSFQARLAEGGSGLPTLWTAKIALVDPGDAVELPIEGSDARYFVPGRAAAASIYRPGVASHPIHGRCSVRIRQVLPDVGGATVLEGTFATQERIEAQKNDLVWLRLTLAAGPVNLYARMEAQTALASGEYRFRTVAQRFSPEINNQLKTAAGVPIGNTPFEVLSLLSTPVDLYALGVLGVRSLLVNPRTPLPVVLDEVLSLARQVATEHDPAVSLGLRIHTIFDRDKRWLESLGPQHLVHEEVSPEDAFDLVPAEVWWDVLAALVRSFPGIGPDSACADFGDAPSGGIHKVFDRLTADLSSLLLRTRSLIVIDWRANREIHSVIRNYLTGLAEGPTGPITGR